MPPPSPSYYTSLESKLASTSAELETLHLDAALDYSMDSSNPSSVPNCLSPFVPSPSSVCASIPPLLSSFNLPPSYTFLDLGCGDGRVCISLSLSLPQTKCLGIDVSPLCVSQASANALSEGRLKSACEFLEADVVGMGGELDYTLYGGWREVKVVYMFIFPTLLEKVWPFLNALEGLEVLITNTYHFEGGVEVQHGWRRVDVGGKVGGEEEEGGEFNNLVTYRRVCSDV